MLYLFKINLKETFIDNFVIKNKIKADQITSVLFFDDRFSLFSSLFIKILSLKILKYLSFCFPSNITNWNL